MMQGDHKSTSPSNQSKSRVTQRSCLICIHLPHFGPFGDSYFLGKSWVGWIQLTPPSSIVGAFRPPSSPRCSFLPALDLTCTRTCLCDSPLFPGACLPQFTVAPFPEKELNKRPLQSFFLSSLTSPSSTTKTPTSNPNPPQLLPAPTPPSPTTSFRATTIRLPSSTSRNPIAPPPPLLCTFTHLHIHKSLLNRHNGSPH